MNLELLKSISEAHGSTKIYVKRLSPNDNSKNQVYLGGNFEVLNILPIREIKAEEAGSWNEERFKAKINFSWIDDAGNLFPAPNAQLILYPKYPEVRFSGFLQRCENPPSELMASRLPNRILFISITNDGHILGYVTSQGTSLFNDFNNLEIQQRHGVFDIIELSGNDNRELLLHELERIHNQGWIRSKRLDKEGNTVACEAPNCGGYTLEAELGITPNGYSEPDYLGWEVKQFGVSNFEKINSAIITLMTPEPTDGIYKDEGAEAFLRKYGYPDKNGKEDRINFGGVHKMDIKHSLTKLEMKLIGFDVASGKIRSSTGRLALVDEHGNETASWSFSSMLLHWNRKHNQACYVPALSDTKEDRKYRYGNKVILGSGTDFQLFLSQMAAGHIYYDPGIKMENASTKPKIKKRSQFRIKSQHLPNLYQRNEVIDIMG